MLTILLPEKTYKRVLRTNSLVWDTELPDMITVVQSGQPGTSRQLGVRSVRQDAGLYVYTLYKVRRKPAVSMYPRTIRSSVKIIMRMGVRQFSATEFAHAVGITNDAARYRLYKLRELGVVWNPKPGKFELNGDLQDG